MDVILGTFGYNAVLAAHRLKLFPLLASGPCTVSDVCTALNIKHRPAQAILAAASALGFVQSTDGSRSLTPLSEKYLLDTSPTYYGPFVGHRDRPRQQRVLL